MEHTSIKKEYVYVLSALYFCFRQKISETIMLKITELLTIKHQRVRLAISLFFFSHGLVLSSWASRIPDIKTNFRLSDAELGILLLFMPIGQIITMPFSARIIRKYGSLNTVRFGFLFYPLILLLIGLSTSYIHLAIALFLFGMVGNLCNISINTQGVELESVMHKPMMASFHGAWSISGFAGALIALVMLNLNLAISIHFFVIFLLVVTIWAFNFRLLLPSLPSQGEKKDSGSIFKHLDKNLVHLGIIGFLSMAIEGAMFDWSGVYFQDIVKAPEQLIILGYTSFVLMMALGRFLGDYFVIKLGRKRVVQLSGILMSSGLILSVCFPDPLICAFAFMIVGLGGSCSVPTVYGVVGKIINVDPSISLTLVSTIAFLGFLVGPPVIGFVAEIFDLRYSYLLFSIFGVIMFFVADRTKAFN